MKFILLAFGAMQLAFTGSVARAGSEIAVATRYLQAEGESHAQLYLYREDGKLLRQLTKWTSGQVMSPVFAPDGATIVFRLAKGKQTEYWSVEPKGGNLHKLSAAPGWYSASKDSSYYTNNDPSPEEGDVLRTPDGKQELALKATPETEDPDAGTERYGKYFELRDLKTGKKVKLGTLPGFIGFYGVLHLDGNAGSVYLIKPPLRTVFLHVHLNSTDGDTVFALDLVAIRLVRLSNNWAGPVLLPDEPAFLSLCQARYVTIPGSTKSANCSYLERWDSDFKKVRYAGEEASICYGASMYRPGGKPAVIVVGKREEE